MPYHLYSGPSLENLLDRPEISILFRPQLFGPGTQVIVQNQNMSQWLKIKVTQTQGVFGGLTLNLPEEALRDLVDLFLKGSESKPVLFMDDLKLVLFSRLKTWLTEKPIRDQFPGLIPFFKRCDESSESSAIFEMADAVAGLFHNYAMNSHTLPAQLSKGTIPQELHQLEEHFKWQSRLWQEVFGTNENPGPFSHLGLNLRTISKKLPQIPKDELPALPFKKILIMGSSFLNPQAYGLLRNLSRVYKDLEIHQVLFWPFSISPTELSSAVFENIEGPGKLWGRFGFQSSEIYRLDPPDQTIFDNAKSCFNLTTDLGIIQQSIVSGINVSNELIGKNDQTLRLLSCNGSRREIEVLKNEIQHRIKENPNLQLNQIAILAPDLTEYGPLLPGSFSEDQGLPFNHSDGKPHPLTPYFNGWTAMLDLLERGFTRSKAFNLFLNPCFLKAQGLSENDASEWLRFVVETHGFRDDPSASSHSFQKSLERLWQGAAFLDHGIMSPQEWEATNIYPWTPSGTGLQNLGKFFQTLEILQTGLPQGDQTFSRWLEVLETLENNLLSIREGEDDFKDRRDQEMIRQFRGKLGALENQGLVLKFSEFRCFLNDQIKHHSVYSGGFLTRGLNFASLKSLRSVPFEVINILGLSDRRFPSLPAAPSFDLMDEESFNLSLDQEASDRYSFLETILNAKSQLTISYHGASEQDNSPLPPSQVLEELLDWLGTSFKDKIIKHKVHDLDVSYFQGSSELFSYDEAAAELANALESQNQGNANTTLFWKDYKPSKVLEITSIDWLKVERMIRNPLKHFCKSALDLDLFEKDLQEWDNQESWELEDYEVLNGFFKKVWQQYLCEGVAPTPEEFFRHYQGAGLVESGAFSKYQIQDFEKICQEFIYSIQKLELKSLPPVNSSMFWDGRPLTGEIELYKDNKGRLLVPFLHLGTLKAKTKICSSLRAAAALTWLPENQTTIFPLFVNLKTGETTMGFSLNSETAKDLVAQSEKLWKLSTNQALPFYADFIEQLLKESEKKSIADLPPQDWNLAWLTTMNAFSKSDYIDGDSAKGCPARNLLFPEGVDWEQWKDSSQPWFDNLYLPLLKLSEGTKN